ncbi:restriction endonuclease subunit S [Agromyces laixinhei]|uniref:restriction endonuclease subunit S n=1 Tax=Agromyces laixinhei TaxID=2585717 RepID=UPI0011171AC0|nr:restriction endonuclease subunit S [Agromyces laixinhei]
MSEWRELELGRGLRVKHGWAFKGEHFRDSGEQIVLTPGNFHDGGGFKPKNGTEKFYDGAYPEQFLLKRGDVVTAMTEQAQGLLGSTATIPSDETFLHNQRIGLVEITDPEVLDLRYVYHLMNAPVVRRQLQATATGSKVRHTAPERIQDVRVAVPDIPTQQVIAEVLDTVDDLIENNRRRVAVLEEMARAIYREWFVQFRYPGHEDVPLVDSALGPIPEGWIAGTVGDALELKYGKALKADARRGGEVAVVSSAGLVGWHDESIVGGPAIVVGRKGNVGSVHWIDGPCWPIDTAYYVATRLPLRFVVEQLRRTEFTNTHAAVPGLSREGAYARPFLIPPNDLLDNYQGTVDPLGTEASALARQSDSLVSLRDLLLPKLVTGQIDVSALDLDALVQEGVGS